jgi:hypothetical protein
MRKPLHFFGRLSVRFTPEAVAQMAEMLLSREAAFDPKQTVRLSIFKG